MGKARIVLAVVILVTGCGWLPAAHAQEQGAYEQSTVILYRNGPMNKLGRGVANLATGVAELPLAMERTARADGQVAGATVGTLRGMGLAIRRVLVGGFEMVTFLLPSPNVGYTPIVQPEYLPLEELI